MTAEISNPAADTRVPLSSRRILPFYVPLVLNALLLTLAGPMLNVVIGRATEPKLELAAFWIAFGIVLLAQSVCVVMQQVTVALSGHRDSLVTLTLSALAAGIAASCAVFAISRTPLGDHLLSDLIPTTARTAALVRVILERLTVLPLLIAVRSVANGVAISRQRTGLIAGATIIRLSILTAAVAAVVVLRIGSGALAAASALVIGVGAETLFVLVATGSHGLSNPEGRTGAATRVSSRDIMRVAAPLAVAMLAWTATRPAVNAILGRLHDAELAQAAFGVVLPVLLVGCSPLWALLDVALVLPADRRDLGRVIRFAAATAATFSLAIAVLTLTPFRLLLLRLGFHLSPEMEGAVTPALALVALEPVVLAARAVSQGIMMRAGHTGRLLIFSPLKIFLIIAVGTMVATHDPFINGASLAIALVVGGDLLDAVLYGLEARRLIARGLAFFPGESAGRADARGAVLASPPPGWAPIVAADRGSVAA